VNIDPKSCEIKNEKMLRDIEELKAPSDYPEIVIKFLNRDVKSKKEVQERKIGFFPSKKYQRGVTNENSRF